MKKNKYYYKIYGLNIESEIKMLELMEGNDKEWIDVQIIQGEMPEFIREQKKRGRYDYIKFPEYHWFYKERAGDFYIENGERILISVEKEYNETMLHAMLLGWGLGIIFQQREIVAIHGGAIVCNEKAFIISGDSGAGKTTIVTELLKEQMGFLADDTVVVDLNQEGQALAEPAYPLQKLCKDAAIASGYNITKLKVLDEDRDKYALPRWQEFVTKQKEIRGMFVIQLYKGEEVRMERIEGREKLKILLDNLYTQMIHRCVGISPCFMKECIEFIKYVPIYRVRRPIGKQTTQEITECIKEIMKFEEIKLECYKERMN